MGGPRMRADGVQQVPAAPIEEQRPAVHEALVFENAPVSLWREDFSGVKQRIDSLSQEGIEDFRKYFENHTDVVAECARLVTVLDVNRAAVKLHHAGSKKELTDSLTSRFSEESYEVFREELIALANGETSFELDAAGLTLDGERIDVILRMFVDPNSPNWSSVYVALTDITERKQAEEASRLSAEIAEHMAEGINLIRIDDGIIVYTNDRFDEIFGYGQGELIGQHVAVLNAAGETNPKETASEIIHGVAKNGSWHGEIFNVKKDRTEFWSRANVSTFEHSQHGPVFLTVQEDITERKAATEALFQSEKRLRDILDGLFGFVGIYTTDGVLIEANRAPLEAAGLKKEDVIGKPFWETYWWSYSPEVQEQLKEALRRAANGETVRYDVPVRIAGDRLIEIDVMFGPLFDSKGNISQLLGFGVDITERKRAEEEKRKLQDQLRHAQKMDAVGQLAAGVAHEFNNFLVGILGNAELLLAAPGDDLPERFKRPLKDIERSGTRAADLTKQLLSFARKKNHNISLLDVNKVITGSKGMLQRLVGESITLKTVLAPDPALVRADEAEIEQAILNLVMNARDAMPNGGTLAIRTDSTKLKANEVAPDCKPGRYVRLSVIDDGCGMPPEIAERIFEPFFTTKSVGKGTGLGLSTIFADVTNSGGFVKVESHVGEGTVIRIHLPQGEGAIERTDAGAEHASRPVGGNETILLCDDEEIVLASVAALLQTLGYPIIYANSPQEAIEVAAAYDGPISLLLTDVTMPGMDGIELGKEIMRFYPDIRVILTSGYAEDVLRGRAGENEHFEFLQKPVPYDMLARTIREVLD